MGHLLQIEYYTMIKYIESSNLKRFEMMLVALKKIIKYHEKTLHTDINMENYGQCPLGVYMLKKYGCDASSSKKIGKLFGVESDLITSDMKKMTKKEAKVMRIFTVEAPHLRYNECGYLNPRTSSEAWLPDAYKAKKRLKKYIKQLKGEINETN